MQSLRAVTRRHAIQSVRSLCLRCPSVCHIHPSPSPTSTCTSSLLVSHRIPSLTSTSFPSHRSRGFATLGGVTVTDLGMPALSPTMEKGNVAKWKIAVGDRIKPGEVICSIETDKATVDFEAQEEGYLAAIFLGDGTQDVPVGKAIGVMVDDKEDVAKVQAALKSQPASTSTSTPAAKPTLAASTPAPKPASKPAPAPPASAPTPATPSKSTTSTSTPAPTSTSTSTSSSSIQHPPSVLHLLHNHHLDPSSITATGKNGRLTKGDVLMAIAKGTAKKAADKPATATATATTTSASTPSSSEPAPRLRGNRTHIDIPSTQMRKVIASRLAQSKSTIPHAYASTDVVMDQLLKLRSSLKASGTTVPSVNDFIIRASALALRDHPSVARYWDPKTNDIKDSSSIDISVAVATDTGLITPIVKKADTKRIGEISTIVKDLAQRARQNKLKPDEFMGGAFTISNLGMFGIDQFAAVINPPQSCILAVGGSKSIVRPVSHPTPTPTTDGSASLQLETVSIMSVTLSCDGRVVDAEQAGIWLTSFRNYLENPTTMLQ